jgi:hypothetical protein
MKDGFPHSYLIVEPETPTAEEIARGARLIPSMLDEGVRVWRVPGVPLDELTSCIVCGVLKLKCEPCIVCEPRFTVG